MKPTRSFHSLLQEPNRVGIEFLLVEVRMGLTFLDVADSTESKEHRRRSLENACTIYRPVAELLSHVIPSPAEDSELRNKLSMIKERLLHGGLSVEA